MDSMSVALRCRNFFSRILLSLRWGVCGMSFHRELMRRLVFDLLTILCLITAGVALYQVSSGVPVNFVSRFENVIWIAVAVVIAVIRVRLQILVFRTPKTWWFYSAEWIAIIITANLALFWLDVIIHPRDDFKTMFAFGF